MVSAGLAGCSPPDEFLRADVTVVEIGAEDTSHNTVSIESSSSWMVDASGSVDWLELGYEEGDPWTLWVTALLNESPDPRESSITVVSGDGLTLTIPVVQSGMNIRFGVTPTELQPFGARDTGAQTLTVDTGLSWQAIQLHGDWITLTKGTEQGKENTLAVGVKATRIFEERRDTIVLQPVNEVFHRWSDSLVVVQEGIGLVVTAELMNEQTLEITIPADGGEVPMSVFSKEAWLVTTDASPDRVTFDMTGSGSDIENGIPIVMTVTPNTSTEEDHAFTLSFESGGETYEYRCRQQASVPPEQSPEPEEGI